jgi:hypothetical protein
MPAGPSRSKAGPWIILKREGGLYTPTNVGGWLLHVLVPARKDPAATPGTIGRIERLVNVSHEGRLNMRPAHVVPLR